MTSILFDGSDGYMTLPNTNPRRKMNISPTWTSLRIALRIRIPNPSGASTYSGTPTLAVGLSKGTATGVGDETTEHWVGALHTDTSWGYDSAGGSGINRWNVSDVNAAVKVGGTMTTGTKFVSTSIWQTHPTWWGFYFVEITKGSPNWTINGFFPTIRSALNNTYPPSETNASMRLYAEQIGTVVKQYYGYGTPATVAVDEGANGVLDSVNIWWDRVWTTLQVADIYVVRLA